MCQGYSLFWAHHCCQLGGIFMLSQSPFLSITCAANETAQRPNRGVVLGKHKRGKMTVCHVSYILPSTTIVGNIQRQILGYTDLCVEFLPSVFLITEKAFHFHTESGTESWAFWITIVSSRPVFPYSVYGIPCGRHCQRP